MWDWNVETGNVVWSDQMYSMHGYSPDEVEPSFGAWAQRVHPDDLSGLLAALDRALDQRNEFDHTFRLLFPDSSIHWCSARGRHFFDRSHRALRMLAIARDVTDEYRERERLELLAAELQHRTRNLIGVIRALAVATAQETGDLTAFQAQFEQRLQALSRVQGLLSHFEETPITLEMLIRMELEALGAPRVADQIIVQGPEVRLERAVVQTLALAIHELATNALKYGALREASGRLEVAWSLHSHPPDGNELHLRWFELATEAACEDQRDRAGYGRELLEKMLPYVLDAKTEYCVLPTGARCIIQLPVCLDQHTGSLTIVRAQ
jgi:PAS domain S-box-containing protein